MQKELLPAVMMIELTFASLLLIMLGLKSALQRTGWAASQQWKIFISTLVVILVWVLLTGILATKGFFSDFSKLPPRPAFAILLPLPFVLAVAFSKKGSTLLQNTPPHWLIGMQAFRIVVELLLWRAFLRGLLPEQMTFTGYNFDVWSGILAIPAALIIKRKWSPTVSLVYNIIGILLLINILSIAILSMPGPLRHFMNEPSSALVGKFPFIYLPGVLVVMAYSLHIFSLRQWWILRKNN
jgi:hypothetical protein